MKTFTNPLACIFCRGEDLPELAGSMEAPTPTPRCKSAILCSFLLALQLDSYHIFIQWFVVESTTSTSLPTLIFQIYSWTLQAQWQSLQLQKIPLKAEELWKRPIRSPGWLVLSQPAHSALHLGTLLSVLALNLLESWGTVSSIQGFGDKIYDTSHSAIPQNYCISISWEGSAMMYWLHWYFGRR